MITKYQGNAVIGIPKEIKQRLRNQPDGKIRFIFRNDDVARAFVKTENRITEHHIYEVGTQWELSPVIRANVTIKPNED